MGLDVESITSATKTAGAATKAAGAMSKAAVTINQASDTVGNVRPVVKRVMRDKQTRKALAEALGAGRRVYIKVGSEPRVAASRALSDASVQRDLAEVFMALKMAAVRINELAERRKRSRTWLWISGGLIAALAAGAFLYKRARTPEPEYEQVEEPAVTP